MIHSTKLAIKYSRKAEQLWNEGMSADKAIRTSKIEYIKALKGLENGGTIK